MRYFEQLGDAIEQAFADANYDEREFPGIALRLLETHSPHASFVLADLVRWVHSASQIPNQKDVDFGEPPVRLYAGRRFFIEALFWLDGTPAIHQHNFSGAFQVLAGSTLHTCFTFQAERAVNKALVLGQLRAGRPELLRAGDTRTIEAASGLIHSTFHLERPSVTLVVRTYHEPSDSSQLHYVPPGIALSSFHYDARLPRTLQLFDTIFRGRVDGRAEMAIEFLERADLHSSFLVLQRLSFIAQSELDVLIDIVCARHPFGAKHVRAGISELRRQTLIIERRKKVHDPHLRYFLALLLNVERRADILRLVREWAPLEDPIELVVDWVGALCSTAHEDDSGGYFFGETELEIVRQLLQERSVAQILDALAADYDDVETQAEQVSALCAAMAETALLRPLLRRHEGQT